MSSTASKNTKPSSSKLESMKHWIVIYAMITLSYKPRWILYNIRLMILLPPIIVSGCNWNTTKIISQNPPGKREKLLKLIHSLLHKFSHKGKFLFVCNGTYKILGVGVMLGSIYDHFHDDYYTLFPYVYMCFSSFEGSFWRIWW